MAWYNEPMNEDNIFTKIVKGEIPCNKVYEDELTLAFLDIHPVQPGHTLVIPKKQIEFVWDMDDENYQAVMATAKKVAQRLKEVIGKPFIGSEVVGVDVPHAHIHLIPFSTPLEFRRIPDMSAEPNFAELEKMAARLAF